MFTLGLHMSDTQSKRKSLWVAVALSIIWGMGHFYLNYKMMGILLVVLEVLYLFSFQTSWISIIAFIFCTIIISFDALRKAIAIRRASSLKKVDSTQKNKHPEE